MVLKINLLEAGGINNTPDKQDKPEEKNRSDTVVIKKEQQNIKHEQ